MKNKKKGIVCFLIVLILIILSSYVFADGWCAPSGCGDCKLYTTPSQGDCCSPFGKKCAESINAIVNCVYDEWNDYGCLYEDVNTGYTSITYCGAKESCVQYSDCKTFSCMDDCYKYGGFCSMTPSGSYTEIRNIYPDAEGANGFCQYINRWSYGLCIKCNAGYHQDGYACVPDCIPSCPENCGQSNGCGGTCPATDKNTCGKCGNAPYYWHLATWNIHVPGNIYDSTSDDACCPSTVYGVLNHVCYDAPAVRTIYSGLGFNGKNSNAVMLLQGGYGHGGYWYNCDTGWNDCRACSGYDYWGQGLDVNRGSLSCPGATYLCWVNSGESTTFGEYAAKGEGCCGDDPNEYYKKDYTAACCDSPNDCVDESGDCKAPGELNDAGTHKCIPGWLVMYDGKCGQFLNSCDPGTFQDVTDTSTYYKWNCLGSAGGTTASCSLIIPINGACGTANGKTYSYSDTSWGDYKFCSVGTTSPANPSFPAQGSSTNWQCLGSNGGTTASCSASRSAAPVNGICGASVNTCNPGTPQDEADTATEYKWTCLGSNGGSNAPCSLTKCETEAGKCNDGIDNDCDGHTDGEDASCIYVNSITAPSTASKDTAFTITCGISSTTKLANCIGVKVDGVAIPDSNFLGWSGTSPQFTYTSSTTGQKTLECYISNKIDGCTIGSDTGNPTSSSKTTTITINPSLCSERTQTECTGLCKWCSSCSSTQSFTGTSQCIDSASTCGYSCKKNSCNALCDANDGTNCDLSTCSCKTSGACDASTKICTNYYCSSGQVCNKGYYWYLGACTPSIQCSPTWPSAGSISGNKACCPNVFMYDTYGNYYVDIEVINPQS